MFQLTSFCYLFYFTHINAGFSQPNINLFTTKDKALWSEPPCLYPQYTLPESLRLHVSNTHAIKDKMYKVVIDKQGPL